MISCGVDPGRNGAIAVFKNDDLIDVIDVVSFNDGGSFALDTVAMVEKLKRHVIDWAVIERIQPTHKDKARLRSFYGLTRSFGNLESLISMNCGTLFLDSPSAWKRRINLNSGPANSLEMARGLYGLDWLHRGLDHNRADAMLIHYSFKQSMVYQHWRKINECKSEFGDNSNSKVASL